MTETPLIAEPTPEEKSRWFKNEQPGPEPGVFELGLVLGGTVSAAAYTAGALDFLLQALERFTAEGVSGGKPWHRVRFTTVAGASGGAMCSALLALLSRKQVPHIDLASRQAIEKPVPTGNPLWDIWVNAVDGAGFLSTGDVGDGKLMSLLNTRLIDQIGRNMVAFAGSSGSFDRPYFPPPFRYSVTLTNLRGIPYKLDVAGFEGWSGGSYTAHDDVARFAVPNGAEVKDKRPDEFWVDPAHRGATEDTIGYETMVEYAKGSGAFPVGLASRPLSRPARHYAFRPVVRAAMAAGLVDFPQPDWPEILSRGTSYEFVAVDGGTFNNDPVQLVHRDLAGMLGQNPRDPDKATRALLMIDPLATKPRALKTIESDLETVAKALIGAVVDGARYLTADMVALADPKVFSRFQLVPTRPDLNKLGEDALTTAPFSAFGGFFCREFRVHDFMLGRMNMQTYLRTRMTLRGDNPLFDDWPQAARERFAVTEPGARFAGPWPAQKSDYFLPIIPDMSYQGTGELAVVPDHLSLPWPFEAFDPEDMHGLFQQRVDAVLNKLREQEIPGFLGWLGGAVLEPFVASKVTDIIVGGFRDDLVAAGLLRGTKGKFAKTSRDGGGMAG